MTTALKICGFFVFASFVLTSHQAQGQGFRTNVDRMTPAMKYFGHGLRMPVAHPQSARPQSRRSAPPTQQIQSASEKPFQNVHRRPTISPYLGLDSIESNVGLPNYYSRVLPQLQQQEANDAQATELRRLQRQVRTADAQGTIANPRKSGTFGTDYNSQFLNHSGYFPMLRR